MSLWFTEQEADSIRTSFAISEVLHSSQSSYQKIEVVETFAYGKMLILDGCVMLTEKDEFVYHEMIAHVPMGLKADAKQVLIIGGGDGGTVREFLRYPGIEKIILAEIDSEVVEVSRKFFPSVSSGLKDSRVEIKIGDGVAYLGQLEKAIDLLVIDSTDPVGPGEGLFTGEFYRSAARALKPGGIMVAQSESPWHSSESLQRIWSAMRQGFQYVTPYVGAVPTYPRGFWSWTLASQDPIQSDKMNVEPLRSIESQLKYLTPELAKSAFALPRFFADKLK